uniref:mannose-6-phosphate isomerase n=2 Tax=Nyssomyia neivai TaxID=330878 RepID=A0A1L8E205_9DIPT
MLNLLATVKNYHWGRKGPESLVYHLAVQNSQSNVKLPENEAYAELWMGNHVMDPSLVKETHQPLGEYLAKQAVEVVGATKDLPFLLKVLSIQTALSIQVHPNKEEAEELHKFFPDIYKDDNHKPEMAIALTPFLALCGFRPPAEIVAFIDHLSAFGEFLGQENVEKLRNDCGKSGHSEGIKACFTKLMESSTEDIKKCIKNVEDQLKCAQEHPNVLKVFQTLLRDFPDDVGILSIFFFHIMELNVGEAMFISANEPHAYIYGECIEAMACSDNVIRAGLTPKPKDIPTLIRMLNYTPQTQSSKIFTPQKYNDDPLVDLFSPPVKDFAVIRYRIPAGVTKHTVKLRNNASVLVVISGEAKLECQGSPGISVNRGSVIFLPGNIGKELSILMDPNVKEHFEAYQATYNDF